MSFLADLTARVADLEARLQNILQIAKVKVVHDSENLLDVEVRGVMLEKVPWLTQRAGPNGQVYWVPEFNEVGLLLSPAGDVGNSVFLPALFYDTIPAPEADQNIMRRLFTDDADEKWNFNDDEYMLRIGGDATRKTNKDPAKIEDAAHDSKLTLEEGTAKLEASSAAKVDLDESGTAELAASGTAKLVIQATPGMASLEATAMAKLVLNAIVGNLMGAHLFPSGITTLMSPVGPVLFAPAPSPSAPPTPPAGSAPDSEGNVTQTPPSIISGITWQNGTLSFTIPSLIVTGVAGTIPVTGTTAPLVVSLPITGSGITLQFPAQSL